jgi:hypothetical protein
VPTKRRRPAFAGLDRNPPESLHCAFLPSPPRWRCAVASKKCDPTGLGLHPRFMIKRFHVSKRQSNLPGSERMLFRGVRKTGVPEGGEKTD